MVAGREDLGQPDGRMGLGAWMGNPSLPDASGKQTEFRIIAFRMGPMTGREDLSNHQGV